MYVPAPCGRVCEKCNIYGLKCEGCRSEMTHSSYRCDVFDCASSKGYVTCTECDVLGCTMLKGKSICPLLVIKETQMGINLGL